MFDLDYGKTAEVEIGGQNLRVERIRFSDIKQYDLVLHSWQDKEGNFKNWVGEATVRAQFPGWFSDDQIPGWFSDDQSYFSNSSEAGWEERNFPTPNRATVAYDWHDTEDGHALFRILSGWDAS